MLPEQTQPILPLWKQSKYSDCKVSVKDTIYDLHRAILSEGPYASTFFHTHFTSAFYVPGSVIDLNNLPEKVQGVFENFLEFIYDKNFAPTPSKAVPLIRLAQQLMVPLLYENSLAYVKRNLPHSVLFLVDALELLQTEITEFLIPEIAAAFETHSNNPELMKLDFKILMDILEHPKFKNDYHLHSTFFVQFISQYIDEISYEQFVKWTSRSFSCKECVKLTVCCMEREFDVPLNIIYLLSIYLPAIEPSDLLQISPSILKSMLIVEDSAPNSPWDLIAEKISYYFYCKVEVSKEEKNEVWSHFPFEKCTMEALEKMTINPRIPIRLIIAEILERYEGKENEIRTSSQEIITLKYKISDLENTVNQSSGYSEEIITLKRKISDLENTVKQLRMNKKRKRNN